MLGQAAPIQQEPLPPDWLDRTDMAIGDILRQVREHYGLTLQDVEKALRIRAIQLSAIEEGDIERLPGRAYAVGYVRAYAEFLGLDGSRMVQLFKHQAQFGIQPSSLHVPAASSESKVPGPLVIAGSILSLSVFMIIYALFTGEPQPETQIPPAETRSRVSVSRLYINPPLETALRNILIAHTPQLIGEVEAATASRITISTSSPAWVEIRSESGDILISRILDETEIFEVPDRPDLYLTTGNMGALSLSLDGETLRPLGRAGDVRRDVPLTVDHLLTFAKEERKLP